MHHTQSAVHHRQGLFSMSFFMHTIKNDYLNTSATFLHPGAAHPCPLVGRFPRNSEGIYNTTIAVATTMNALSHIFLMKGIANLELPYFTVFFSNNS